MDVFVEKENRTIKIKFAGKAGMLLKRLKINPEAVLIVRNEALVTQEDYLHKNDSVSLLSVISGG